uniref:hypothetical protein n=1 Tax=Fulvivirga sp. TaxID=1931237 RepID=UPI00404AA6D8
MRKSLTLLSLVSILLLASEINAKEIPANTNENEEFFKCRLEYLSDGRYIRVVADTCEEAARIMRELQMK